MRAHVGRITTSTALLLLLGATACGLLPTSEKPDGQSSSSSGGGGQPDGSTGDPDGGSAPDGSTGNPDGGAGDPDGGSTGDGGPVVGPEVGTTHHLGGFTPSRVRTVLSSDDSSWVFLGYQGVGMYPQHFGIIGGSLTVSPTGVMALNSLTGESRLYTAADGLPTFEYFDLGNGTASVSDMAWIEEGSVFAMAAMQHVVRAVVAEDGTLSFTHAQVRREPNGPAADLLYVVHAGGELFVSTSMGIAVLDASTLEVLRWPDLGLPFQDVWSYQMTSGTLAGAEVVAVVVSAEQTAPSHVVILTPGNAQGRAIEVQGHVVPLSILGMDGRILVGGLTPDGDGTIQQVTETDGQLDITMWATAEDLQTPRQGEMVPKHLAYDVTRNAIVIGGGVVAGSLAGGGVARIDLALDGTRADGAYELFDPRDRTRLLLGQDIDTVHVDPLGRYWIGSRRICSESRLGPVGLYRVEEFQGAIRVARPLVSGIHAITVDPVQGDTWLSMRDENQGLQCNLGLSVQQGVCRLRADGSCEMYVPYVNHNTDLVLANISAFEVAFGDPSRKEMAIATRRDALFMRTGDITKVVMTQLDPKLSLNMTSAAWGAPGELWVGSEMEWQYYDDPELDEEAINDRGPHGLGLLTYSADARPQISRRYVRKASDSLVDDEVEGLPSNHIWDVLPLSGSRRAVVAMGWEREQDDMNLDHVLGPTSDRNHNGGIAVINDESVIEVNPPQGVTLGEVTALASIPGRVLALDSEAGVLEVDVDGLASSLLRAPSWESPERGRSLAVDGQGRIAVGTTHGLYVYGPDGGVTTVFHDQAYGWVWSLRFMADGVLYAGTDHGLVRVALEEAALPEVLGRTGPLEREPWELPLGCYGDETCACDYDHPCAPGLSCECDLGVCACETPVPCQGEVGCGCDAQRPCNDGLECNVENECVLPECANSCSCTTLNGCPSGYACSNNICMVDTGPPECANNCTCNTANGCPVGFICQGGIAGDSCVMEFAPPSCADDCSCSTASGCPDGFICQGGFAGNSCVEDVPPGPPVCASDCSCSTASGCPDGYTCQGGFAGNSCVEDLPPEPPACASDCSCSTVSGCPDGYTCQGGFAGNSCVEDLPPEPPACASDCSCNTIGGCPDGYVCQSGIVGDSCIPAP